MISKIGEKQRERPVKVPSVLQMETLECGAACLCMVLAYHEKWITLEESRAACGVSRDGSNAANIAKAARKYGLATVAHRYSVNTLKSKVSYPAILHWGGNHFVVLCGFKGKNAIINDPGRGTVVVGEEEFGGSFSGICIEFSKTETFVPSGKPEGVYHYIKDKLKDSWVPVLFVMLAALLMGFIGIVTPIFSRLFVDDILPGTSPSWLAPLLIALAVLAMFQLIVLSIRSFYLLKLRGKMAIVSNTKFMWHTLRLPMEFFFQRQAGDIANRQTANDHIAAILLRELAPVLINVALIVFYMVAMLRYSLVLTLVGISTILLNIVLARIVSKKRASITKMQMRDEGQLISTTVSGIEMMETIKSSGAENAFYERWAGYQAAVNRSEVSFSVTDKLLGQVPKLLQSLTEVAVLMLGVWFIMSGSFTVGMLLAFQSFLMSFLKPVNYLIGTGQQIQEMGTLVERVEDVMRYRTDVPEVDRQEIEKGQFDKLSGHVEMRNVTFGYSKLAPPLVQNFNLTLEPGSKVAFVGFSGCGKSTLAKLISGLYEPWEGEILFDGKPRNEIPRAVLTGSLSVVDQDVTLFEDSIVDNIKLWDNTIEDFEMILAAKDAQIHEDIMLREGGYQYQMVEGGKNFSGGQRQRLEIARVLAGDPTIVVLDEATSSMDSKTEYELTKAITDRGLTCVIIAHRLSTIRDCDEIVVMEKGQVKERGTHDVLLKQGGLYARLIQTV